MIGSWYKVLDRLVVGGSKSTAMKKMLVDQVREAAEPAVAAAAVALRGFIMNSHSAHLLTGVKI